MPPKKKAPNGETQVERETTLEATRLRTRASSTLLQHHAPPHTAQIPTALCKCDGADIIKRNANRKKKYLFVFPGALSLPATGGKIGSLTCLDTRNPILNIEFPSGTFRLFGTLVFPQNALIAVKPSKRAVQVMDVFETMIVFSEWRWVGDVNSNPGGVPVPLPDTLRCAEQNLWRSGMVKPNQSGEGLETVDVPSEGESAVVVESDEEGWAAATTERAVSVRSNPRRKGRVVNYSQLENEEGDDGDDGDSEASGGEANTDGLSGIKRRKREDGPQDVDDSVQIVEDVEEVEIMPGRASRRKRRKVNCSQESGDEAEDDKYGDDEQGKVGREDGRSAGGMHMDDTVELVEDVKKEDVEIKRLRGSRRTRRRINYSQESQNEYDVDDEDEGDEDEGDEDFVTGGEDTDLLE